ncbi:class I SAM-dependent methyltransferase [uncultured Psychroserpens sp.]|uniref:class I SAM-dependent methyltransferase n=1 Tax=uncultured Psychroserpens sp. TaxID=255436 RepID=UPI00260C6289|nr:class I SAM-dependent methyltransferase [uncultured Psychroserpens sp.]
MKKKICQFILFATLLSTIATNGQQNYTYKKGDPNGIGKWYMGREIAYVMGFQGIDWLERSEREKEENTSTLLKNMDIRPTDVVADIGAGSGFHVFQMAPMAHKGLIYAVDIQPEMLVAMEYRKESGDIKNVKTIQGAEQSVNLPENSIDKVLMVDVYHEFSYPVEMIASIKEALKPNGKIFLIEYRGEDDRVPIKRLHKMTETQAVKEFEAAGFILEQNIENLPWQHCMVFVKK